MLNLNDLHHYPLRAADLLQSHDEMMTTRRLPVAAACGSGGPRGPDGGDDGEWKREIMALVRATHAMVSALTDEKRRIRGLPPGSRGSAGERPLTGSPEGWKL